MATVYSSRTCLPKLCCSLAAVGLFMAGILITGAYPHPDLNDHNLNQTIATAKETNIASTGNFTLAAESLAIIRANNEALYTHLDAVSDRIEENIKQLEKRFSRSPRAIKAMQVLEAAIAMFDQTHPKPEYQISEYATGKGRWRRAPSVHPLKLRSSSITKPKRSTTKIKYWTTQWRKFSSRTPICLTKSPKNIRPLRRNSRRITQPNINTKPEWPDLQDPVQPPRRRRLPSGSYESWRLHRS
jgi:hypothetical protein